MKSAVRNLVRGIIASLALASALATSQSAPRANAQFLGGVTVNGDRVRLGDLLVPGAAAQLRAAIGSIDLGRAPQPGSFRVFTAARLHDAIGGRFALDLPAQVTVRRAAWPVASQRITAALVAAKLPSGNLSVLGAPLTSTPNALLEVSAVRSGRGPDTMLVRFACRVRADCSPFWGEIQNAGDAIPQGSHPPSRISPPPLAPLVTPGHWALLICAQPGMEIRLRVRPLHPAGLGERVKVMDPETRRVFFARVTAEDLVESDLEEAQ